jgi:hypothetical protein
LAYWFDGPSQDKLDFGACALARRESEISALPEAKLQANSKTSVVEMIRITIVQRRRPEGTQVGILFIRAICSALRKTSAGREQ